jgi:hypothetical protein
MRQLAQTTMLSELGKLIRDKTFEERDSLNYAIVETMTEPFKIGAFSACAMRSTTSSLLPTSRRLWSSKLRLSSRSELQCCLQSGRTG